MSESAELNFVRQQGFRDARAEGCQHQYSSLLFQPRVIGVLVLVGLILQAWPLFLAVSMVLWWNVVFPQWNLFDALYNRFVAGPRKLPRLTPAPAPRRFAQGMAATFMLGIGLSPAFQWQVATWVLGALLVIALVALNFGKFCLGSYVYHLLRGETGFANRTLPWARSG